MDVVQPTRTGLVRRLDENGARVDPLPGVRRRARRSSQRCHDTAGASDVYRRALPSVTGELQILPSRLGSRAGVTGAGSLAIELVLSPESVERLVAERARSTAA